MPGNRPLQSSGASLQTCNNELLKGLTELRENRNKLCRLVQGEEEKRRSLEEQLKDISEQLDNVNKSLAQKYSILNEYDRLIEETNEAYTQIIQSSETLLQVLRKEKSQLATFETLK